MIYLFSYVVCCLLDKVSLKDQQNRLLFRAGIIWIFVFLCFGYMTGSDWRGYELYYNGVDGVSTYRDLGFVWLVNIARVLIADFWVFNALCKIFFLSSIIFSIKKIFMLKPWLAIGFFFTFGLLFMLIDCPMRYMLALGIYFFSLPLFFRSKYLLFLSTCFLAFFFHVTIVLVYVMTFALLLRRRIRKLNRMLILLFYFVCLYLTTNSSFFESMYSILYNTDSVFSAMAHSYNKYSVDSWYNLGALKSFVFLLIVLIYRERICRFNEIGNIVYSGAIIYFFVSLFAGGVPTLFRIAIPFAIYLIISFVLLIKSFKRKYNIVSLGIVLVLGLILIMDVYSSWVYMPYSNSIPYILTEHLPYFYRERYNLL